MNTIAKRTRKMFAKKAIADTNPHAPTTSA